MKIRLILVGRTERGHVEEGMRHYIDRLRRVHTVEEVVLAEAGKGDADFQRRLESGRILAVLRPGERVVALDERGRSMSSPAFAAHLGNWRDQGVRELAFVIGGAYGLNNEVRDRADLVLALSDMTFPHQLVRVLFAEQLYRAFSILQGTPYHH